MARKRKSDAGFLYLLGISIVLIIFVLVIVAFATPVVILSIFAFYCFAFNRQKDSLQNDMSDFWLTASEKSEFKELCSKLTKAEKAINSAIRKAETAGISKNKDGSYSARSKIGKEVREVLEDKEPLIQALVTRLKTLQDRPFDSWWDFNMLVKKGQASASSIALWLATLFGYAFIYTEDAIENMFMPYYILAIDYFGDNPDQLAITSQETTVISIATIVAIATYFLVDAFSNSPATQFSPWPSEVTLANIDAY